MSTHLTKEEKRKIIDLYKDGYPKSYISTLTHRSVDSISKVLKLSGVDPLLFRSHIWDRAYGYYLKHSKSSIPWYRLSYPDRQSIYNIVRPMCQAEATQYLKDLGYPDTTSELQFLREENKRLKHLLSLYFMKSPIEIKFLEDYASKQVESTSTNKSTHKSNRKSTTKSTQ